MIFFRYKKNGGFCDVVRSGLYWQKTEIYPVRLMANYGPDPLPLPAVAGYPWADSRALRKSLTLQGWKLVKRATDNTHLETGNRTTKKKVNK